MSSSILLSIPYQSLLEGSILVLVYCSDQNDIGCSSGCFCEYRLGGR